MEQLTVEQQRALALARARAAAAAAGGQPPAGPASGGPEGFGGFVEPQQHAPQAPQAPQQEYQRAGPVNNPFVAGVGDSVIRTGMGVRGLFGGLSDDNKAVLRQMDEERGNDPSKGWRTTGDIFGNLTMLAVPGAAAERKLRGLRVLSRLGGARVPAAAAGSAAGVEFAVAPGRGDTFGEQLTSKAKQAGIAAAGAGAMQGVLQTVAKPFKNTREAQMLFDQGVNPTLQQGAAGRTGRALGGLTSGVVDVRSRQEKELADALLRRITDGNVSKPRDLGRNIAADADDYVRGLYNSLFANKRFPTSPTVLGKAVARAQRTNNQGQMLSEAKQAGAAVGNIIGPADMNKVNRNLGYDKFREDYLNRLSAAAKAEKNPEVRSRILGAREELIESIRNKRLTPDELARVQQIDAKNFDVNRLKEAVSGSAGEHEGVTLRRLLNAYGDRTMPGNNTMDELLGPASRVIGVGADQSESRALLSSARRVLKGAAGAGAIGAGSYAGLGVPIGAAYGLSAAGQTAGGARALMGQTAKQKALAEFLRQYVVTGATVPSMINQEYEDGP